MQPYVANLLGFHEGNRLGVQKYNVVGGGTRKSDQHRLEHMRVGTAKAHRISFIVEDFGPEFRFFILLGLSFIRKFATTTVNLDANWVLFRSGRPTDSDNAL